MDNNMNVINNSADKMLNRIKTVVRDELVDAVLVEGAIVSRVNEDGTANVYIPPDNDTIFTKISNQTPFELHAGDSVELMLKNGNYNNCWIMAKHLISNFSTEPTSNNGSSSKIDVSSITTKLQTIEEGAQINKIESLSINKSTLAIENKNVELGKLVDEDALNVAFNNFSDVSETSTDNRLKNAIKLVLIEYGVLPISVSLISKTYVRASPTSLWGSSNPSNPTIPQEQDSNYTGTNCSVHTTTTTASSDSFMIYKFNFTEELLSKIKSTAVINTSVKVKAKTLNNYITGHAYLSTSNSTSSLPAIHGLDTLFDTSGGIITVDGGQWTKNELLNSCYLIIWAHRGTSTSAATVSFYGADITIEAYNK